jgi:hypothetical protein
MNAREKAIDKVRKLLELAKSDNVNEAGNAAAMAQELMSKHAISEAMLDVSPDSDEEIEHDVLHQGYGQNLPTWKGQLGVVLSEVNQCKCFRSGPALNIIGRPSDANTVRYLFAYIVRQIDKLAIAEANIRGNVEKTWMNNFRLGAVIEVNRRLQEAHAAAKAAMRREADASDTMGTGVALMRVNNALVKMAQHKNAVEAYGKRNLRLRKRSGGKARYDDGAFKAGKRAGATIDLNNSTSKGGLGSGSRAALKE